MCGRYAITQPPAELAKLFGAIGALPNFPPRFNAAPSQMMPIIRQTANGTRELVLARWGLIPSWSRGANSQYSMINARAETVHNKPSYREAFQHRRCLVPANGFFEWHTVRKRKQPYYFSLRNESVFAFAGLWEKWDGGEDGPIESFTVIVTDANACVAPVHERMPVLLSPDDCDRWLGEGATTPSLPNDLLKPYPAPAMKVWPVSRLVNSPTNDQADVIEPYDIEDLDRGSLI
jgi:putative SOS response-associated peptidase YedK